MRLIDIDAFRKDWGLAERCEDCERDARECQYDQIYTRMDFCGWLDDAEIIDAVQVVRCKDCRYYDYPFPDPKESADAYPERWCCLLGMGGAFGKDDFCSHGERRTDVD